MDTNRPTDDTDESDISSDDVEDSDVNSDQDLESSDRMKDIAMAIITVIISVVALIEFTRLEAAGVVILLLFCFFFVKRGNF